MAKRGSTAKAPSTPTGTGSRPMSGSPLPRVGAQRKYVYGKTREDRAREVAGASRAGRRGPGGDHDATLERLHRRAGSGRRQARTWLRRQSANYELFSRLYIVPDLGKKRLDRLSVRDVQRWLNDLRDALPVLRPGQGRGPAQATLLRRRRCCRQVAVRVDGPPGMDGAPERCSVQAMREELVTRNVAGLVRVPVPRPQDDASGRSTRPAFLESARQRRRPAVCRLRPHAGARAASRRAARPRMGRRRPRARRGPDQPGRCSGSGANCCAAGPRPTRSDAPLPLPEICVGPSSTGDAPRSGGGSRRRGMAGIRSRAHDPVGMPDRPPQLPSHVQGSVRPAGVPVIPVHSTRRTCASLLVALDVHPGWPWRSFDTARSR